MRSRWSCAVNSVENFPPTFCVGESGVDELGMALLELHELAPQRVELPVRDERRVEHVVAELVVGDLGGQLGMPRAGVGGPHDGEANEGHRQSSAAVNR